MSIDADSGTLGRVRSIVWSRAGWYSALHTVHSQRQGGCLVVRDHLSRVKSKETSEDLLKTRQIVETEEGQNGFLYSVQIIRESISMMETEQ